MKILLSLLALATAAHAAQVRTLLAPAEITNSGATSVLRAQDWKGQGTVILAVRNVSGTNPTLAVTLQSSPELTRLTNVPATGAGIALRVAALTNTQIGVRHTFLTNRQVHSITIPLKRAAALTNGNIVVSMYANGTNNIPSGSILGSATNTVTALATNFAGSTFTFTPPLEITTNALTQWFILSGTYTANASNNVTWANNIVASNGTAGIGTVATNLTAVTTNTLGYALDSFNFSNVTTFATVTNTPSVQTAEFAIGTHGILRAVYTIGGTSPNFGASAVLVNQ
jgi:hypothetical protein